MADGDERIRRVSRPDDETLPSRQNVGKEELEWLQRNDGNTTSSLLKSHYIKMRSESVIPLLHNIKNGDKQQQHDSAKALGYIAKSGVLTTQQKLEIKVFLVELLVAGDLSISVAFAILEALERIDPDAFWQLVIGWYGIATQRDKQTGGNSFDN